MPLDPANVLPLEGEIDLHVSPRIESALTRMIQQRPDRVIVDISGVTFIDSSGLAALVHAKQNVDAYGGKFAISGMNEDVRPIFEIARLDQFFVIDPRDSELLAD
jgi:anti-sigma B factor antagonist